MEMKEHFAQCIRMLRMEKGLTQAALAAIIGVSDKAAGSWETLGRIPAAERLSKLADFFEVSVDYLLGREDALSSGSNDENESNGYNHDADSFSRALFSERLALLMQREKLTHQELADTIGINRTQITDYLRQKKQPSIDTLMRIANHFDVSLDYLVGATENPARNR